jgi:hypothetical protein
MVLVDRKIEEGISPPVSAVQRYPSPQAETMRHWEPDLAVAQSHPQTLRALPVPVPRLLAAARPLQWVAQSTSSPSPLKVALGPIP